MSSVWNVFTMWADLYMEMEHVERCNRHSRYVVRTLRGQESLRM